MHVLESSKHNILVKIIIDNNGNVENNNDNNVNNNNNVENI